MYVGCMFLCMGRHRQCLRFALLGKAHQSSTKPVGLGNGVNHGFHVVVGYPSVKLVAQAKKEVVHRLGLANLFVGKKSGSFSRQLSGFATRSSGNIAE